MVDVGTVDAAGIATAARTVLGDDRFARAARRLADEAAAQPALGDVPAVVELLR